MVIDCSIKFWCYKGVTDKSVEAYKEKGNEKEIYFQVGTSKYCSTKCVGKLSTCFIRIFYGTVGITRW